jgi:hypothetical protein
LRGASSRAGDGVPGVWDCFVGGGCAWVAEEDGEAGLAGEVDFLFGEGRDGEEDGWE